MMMKRPTTMVRKSALLGNRDTNQTKENVGNEIAKKKNRRATDSYNKWERKNQNEKQQAKNLQKKSENIEREK